LLLRTAVYGIDVGKQFVFEAEEKQTGASSHYGIRWHELRMRKAIINVLIDDVRFVKNQIPFYQYWRAIVRIHHREVFRLIEQIDVDDLEIHSFFKQDDPASLAEWASGARVKCHHWLLPGVNQCTSFQYSFLSNHAGARSKSRNNSTRMPICER